ncbi:MAG: M1 family peptidase [Planctomycetes bacterium]|nr:M1 family peptidase [Planctomycetota bacterium]
MIRPFRRTLLHFTKLAPLLALAACQEPRRDALGPLDGATNAAHAEQGQRTAPPGSARIGDTLVPGSGNGGYDVTSYDLAFEFDAADRPMRARATLAAVASQALGSFNLDFHGLEIEALEVDGKPARFERNADELTVFPAEPVDQGATFTTSVRYGGIPTGVKDPSAPVDDIGWLSSAGEIYVFSQPNGAMSFFPCNDHPLDKARFTISIDVPQPLEAVANGVLVETREHGERRTFVWKARDPMATYLVTLAIAEFDEQELVGPNGLVIVNYFTKGSRASARKPFERTGEFITFLSETFGPYPFEICGNILSNVSIGLALETQTKPVYGRGAAGEATIVHELAHQWFGNAVSVQDWNDIWINEGISEYAAWMYLEKHKGREAFEQELLRNYVMAREAKASAPGKPGVREMFGIGVYVRGPLALHAVRVGLGDERFLALMRSWVAEHLHGNASLEDFLEHVERHGTPELRATLESWLNDSTMPSVPAWDAEWKKQQEERDARRKAREDERKKRDTQKSEAPAGSAGG